MREQEAARALREIAAAAVRRTEAVAARKLVHAPFDAAVLRRFVEEGEAVAAGAALFAVGDLGRTWVEAEVDEYDAGRVVVGAGAAITAESHPGQTWRGEVDESSFQARDRQRLPLGTMYFHDLEVTRVLATDHGHRRGAELERVPRHSWASPERSVDRLLTHLSIRLGLRRLFSIDVDHTSQVLTQSMECRRGCVREVT
ncbi:MAG: efflux RND transporter periplasmic adaptor subunit [Planctomycetes bacterium]|nr:efflux RND transporter periplasmic adaptor subunit [Planctomycetota bacterium]